MKASTGEPIFFVAAKRSPFGTYSGALAHLSATELGVHAARSALKSVEIDPKLIDQVIFGNVLQTSKDAIYLARHIGLRCEIPHLVPALSVNRLCGSGFEAIIQGARLLSTGEASCALVGGTESLSQAPHVIRGARKGIPLGQGKLEDSLWESFSDTYINMPMAITAENLGTLFEITQEQVDQFCLRSQENYQRALRLGCYKDEIEGVEYGTPRRPMRLEHDEHPRADSNAEIFLKLPKVFKPEGLIHAAAASGICDGAAALVMCSESFMQKHKLKPLGEFISFGITGCDPKLMGLGPVSAIEACLNKVSISLQNLAMVEINEAFAPQVLAVKQALKLDGDKLNIHGGALAIGHPFAASGARIIAHLLHSLKAQPGSFGLGSACIGGGQGIAVLIKSI